MQKITKNKETFGERLARIRKMAGYSQRDLAKETGISQRMIAHYEKQTQYLPIETILILIETLDVSANQLFGIEQIKKNMRNTSLWRKLKQIEHLNPKEKRQLIQLIDTFIEKNKLQQQTQL